MRKTHIQSVIRHTAEGVGSHAIAGRSKASTGEVSVRERQSQEIDHSKIKIIHTMADGTVRDSVEGYEIPYNETTAVVYDLLAKWTMEKLKKEGEA